MSECIDKIYKKISEQMVVCPGCGEISTIGKTIHMYIGGGFTLNYACNKCHHQERLSRLP